MRMNAFKEIKPHGAMVLFAIDNRVSFEKIEVWVREVRSINEKAPIILVACKCDLRVNSETNHDLVSEQEIREKAQELGLQEHIETSAYAEDESVKTAMIRLACLINLNETS